MTWRAPTAYAEVCEVRILYSADLLPGADASAQDAADTAADHRRSEIAFVDATLDNADQLIETLLRQAGDDIDLEIIRIHADQDGLDLISRSLAGRSDIDAIHVFTHGQAGSVELGGVQLDADSLLARSAQIAAWSEALAPQADLLIYGCDVAATPEGRALIDDLAVLTGADVAASDNLTGSTQHGGDWTLERQVGHIETTTLQAAGWDGVLALTAEGSETRVNSNTSGIQFNSPAEKVAMDANGNFVVIWQQSSSSYLAQRYAADGTTLGSAFIIGGADAIAMAPDGRFVIAWSTGDGTGFQRYAADGTAQGSAVTFGDSSYRDIDISVAMADDGRFVIATHTSSNGNVELRRYNANGSANGGTISVGTSNNHSDVTVAMDGASGNFVVAWSSIDNDRIYARLGSLGSASLGSTITVATVGHDSDQDAENNQTTYVTAAMDGNGFVLAWRTSDSGGQVQARVYDSAGVAQGSAFRVNDSSNSEQNRPAIVKTPDGGFIVAFTNTEDDSNGNVEIRQFDSGGTAVGSQSIVNTTTSGVQRNPSIAGDGDGGYVVSWIGNGTGDSSGIFFQRYSGPAATQPPTGQDDTVSLDEDTTYTLALADLSYADADGDAFAGVRIDSLPVSGVLQLNGVAVSAGQTISAADLQAGLLVYTPAANANDSNTAEAQRQIQFSVQDDTGAYATAPNTLTFSITPVNGAPTVLNPIPDQNATEDQAFSFQFAANTFGDVDGDTLSYTAELAGGGALPDWLSFDAATRTFSGTPGNDDVGTVSLTVTADDGNGETVSDTFSIVVANVNDAPTVGDYSHTIDEDTFASGQVIGNDIDVGDSLSYALDDAPANGLAGVNPDGTYTYTPDADFNGTDSFTIIVSDGNGGTAVSSVSITVTPVNDAPVIAGGASAAVAVPENTTAVTTVSATDVEGDTLTWSISGGTDAALFTIDADAGVVSFITAPEFEAPADADLDNVYVVIVEASDGQGGSAAQTISVTVTDVNEAPAFTSTPDTAATQDVLYSYAVTTSDPDAGAVLTISATTLPDWLTLTDHGDGTATLSGTPGNNEVADHSVVLSVSDGELTDTQSFTITVANVNDAPVITSGDAFSIPENTTAITTVATNDPDGDTLAYSIVGGADAALFTIDPNTGALTFTAPRDFETPADTDGDNVYELVVRASDGSLHDDLGITVTVTDVNEAPTALDLSNSAIDENTDTSGGLGVGFLSASDPDADESFTYAIVGGTDSALFSIGGADNDELVIDAGMLDFETKDSYEVTVRVTDSGGLTFDRTFTVTVNDLNEAPTFDSAPITGATQAAAYSYGITASDPDAGAVLTISATTLPDWLTLTDHGDGTATLSGTPGNDEVGGHAVVLQVSDGELTATQSFTITVANVNDAPTVLNPIPDQNATEDQAFNFQFAADTFGDVDGDTLSYSAELAGGGALPAWLSFDAATRTFSGTPGNDDVGSVSLTVTADDGNGETVSDTFSITVANVNDAPTVGNYSHTIDEDTIASGQVVGSDIDVGDSLSYALGDEPTNGIALVNPDGTYTYTPDADFNGTDSFTVTVSDGNGGTATSTVSITVDPVNDAPTVLNPIPDQNATQDQPFSFQFAANTFGDVDGDTLSYTAELAGGGALPAWLSFDAATRTFSGTPGNEDVGSVSLTVTADDGNGGSVSDTFSITVANVNHAPTVGDYSHTIDEDSQASGQVVGNDIDVGDSLSYALGDAPANGIAVVNPDGTYTYTPDADFNGSDSFTVTVSDGNGGTATSTVSITVTPVNDAPVITSGADFSIPENGTAVTTLTATDVDGDSLTWAITGGDDAALFTIDPDTGALSFSLAPDFEAPGDVGANNVYELTVQVSDGNGGSDSIALTVTVTDVNEAPTALDLSASTIDENTDTTGGVSIGTLSATDPDAGESFIYSIVGGADAAAFAIGGAGSDELVISAGVLDFETKDSYEVTVRVTDAGGLSFDRTFTVHVNDLNEAPAFTSSPVTAATQDALYTYSITTTDPDTGATLTISATTLPDWLTLTDHGDGTATLSGTPGNEEVGDHSVVLSVSDGELTDTQSFTITVANVNDAPTVGDYSHTIDEDSQASGQVVGNDIDVGDSLSYALGNAPANGIAVVNPDGTYTYTPDADFNGSDSFTVTVSDGNGNGGTATSTVLITVTPVNDAPTVLNPIPDQNATQDQAFSFQFAADTFGDVDGDTLSYTAELPDNGLLPAWLSFDAATRTFSGTPGNDDVGAINISVIATDPDGASAVTSFTLTVLNVNDAPTVGNYSHTIDEDTFASGQVVGSDIDVGDSLSYALGDAPANGIAVVNPDGTYTYTPDADFNGSDSFTVTVSDGNGGTATSTVSITVDPVNDDPTVGNYSHTIDEDTQASGQVVGSDVDGDDLSYTLADAPANGIAVVNPDGTYTYTPDADFNGSDSFTVVVSDGNDGSAFSTVSIEVRIVVEEDPATPPPPDGPQMPPGDGGGGGGGGGDTETPGTPDASDPRDDAGDGGGEPVPGDGTNPGTGGGSGGDEALPGLQRGGSAGYLPSQVTFLAVNGNDSPLTTVGLRLVDVRDALLTLAREDTGERLPSLALSSDTLDELGGIDAARFTFTEVAVSGVVLSVGVIWWATRMGALLGAMMVTLPAWRNIDPLPILNRGEKERSDQDDEDPDSPDPHARWTPS